MYITFNKETNIVDYKGIEKPISYTSDLELAEVKEIPTITNAQYLTYENGKLIVNEKPQPTEEQKQAKYESLVEKYIRDKYTLSQELAILRQRDTKPSEFEVYNAYAEQCKAQAKFEIYGV